MFEQHKHAMITAAKAALPYEMCGVIYDGEFRVLKNAAPDPINTFCFSDADTLLYATGDPKVEAIVHSHPPYVAKPTEENPDPVGESRLTPSLPDMQQQAAMMKPWVIVALNVQGGNWEVFDWGDHTLDLPLLERPFRHGVEDCYTAVRKWWWQNKQVKLPDFPRFEGWWQGVDGAPPPMNLYLEGFEKAGFKQFDPTHVRMLRPGDVGFVKLRSTLFNHAMVFCGDGQVYHHTPGRLSKSEPLGEWFRRIKFWVRRDE